MRFEFKATSITLSAFLFLLFGSVDLQAQAVTPQTYTPNAAIGNDRIYEEEFDAKLGAYKASVNKRNINGPPEAKSTWSEAHGWLDPNFYCDPGSPNCVKTPTETPIKAHKYRTSAPVTVNQLSAHEANMANIVNANSEIAVLGGAFPTMMSVWWATDSGVAAGMEGAAMLSELKALTRIEAEEQFFHHAQADPAVRDIFLPNYMHCLASHVSQVAGSGVKNRMEAMDVCLGDTRITRGTTRAWNTGTWGTSSTFLDHPSQDPGANEFRQCLVDRLIYQEQQAAIASGAVTGDAYLSFGETVRRLLGDVCAELSYPDPSQTVVKQLEITVEPPSDGSGTVLGPPWFFANVKQQMWEDMHKIQFQFCEERNTTSTGNPWDIAASTTIALSSWQNIQDELVVSVSTRDFTLTEILSRALFHMFLSEQHEAWADDGDFTPDCSQLEVWNPGSALHYTQLLDSSGNLTINDHGERVADIYLLADYIAGLQLIDELSRIREKLDQMTAGVFDRALRSKALQLIDVATNRDDLNLLRAEAVTDLGKHIEDVIKRAALKGTDLHSVFASVYSKAIENSSEVPGAGAI